MARSFDGASGAITTALTTHSTLRSYSIWVWRVSAGEGSGGRLYDKGGNEIIRAGGGGPWEFVRTWTTGAIWTWPNAGDNAWHHYGVTYDAGSTANDPVAYSDGVSQTVTETAAPTGSVVSNANAYLIGNRTADDRTFDGRLAEFAVWDTILTATEMAALSTGTSPSLIQAGSLVSYVPMYGAQTPEPDLVLATAATVSGATWAAHPIGGTGSSAQGDRLRKLSRRIS